MSFQVVYPFVMNIDADTFKDAIKQFAKLNYNLSINSLIITDHMRYMRANLKYYDAFGKNKVGISIMPTTWPANVNKSGQVNIDTWPFTPSVSYDTREYPATTFLNADFVPRIVPLSPSPLLPYVLSGITPSVIRYN